MGELFIGIARVDRWPGRLWVCNQCGREMPEFGRVLCLIVFLLLIQIEQGHYGQTRAQRRFPANPVPGEPPL